MLENAASWIMGSWLGRGLWTGAAAHRGPGRPVGDSIALSFDLDYEADVSALEALLAELDRHSLRATFACVGHWVRKYPEEHQAIVKAGHEIVNHTSTHPDNEEIDPDRHFHLLSEPDLRDQIEAGQAAIEETLAVRPLGFRAPHFGHQHTEAVYPVLMDLGYRYSSSTLASRSPSCGWPYQVGGGKLWEMPVTVCPKHPFSSFDTWHFVRKHPSRHRPGDLIVYLEAVIRISGYLKVPLSLYLDPRDVAEDGQGRAALEMLAQSGRRIGPYAQWLEMLEASDQD
jgi:peptidoglycan/xylan/chitin deacetylase (PgdA/CDA1 family)